jgi:hypothetical protein
VQVIGPQKVWLAGRIVDSVTGRPTAARIHFRSEEGRYLPPYGHRHEVNDNFFEDYGADLKLGTTEYAYVDGTFQIELPVGRCFAEVVKGFEYEPVRTHFEIGSDQKEIIIRLQRPMDWRRSGWVTADTHVHFISPDTAWLQAQAEGINLVNLLASQWGDLYTNIADYTGRVSGASRDDTIIWVGTENRQHFLGHINLLGISGALEGPLCAGGASESYLGDPTWSTIAEWADRARIRDGVVVVPHFPNPYAEVVADIILGKIDAVEIRDFHSPTLDTYGVNEWYRFLNLGYRVAAVGGTDKMSAAMPVGGVRTYALLGESEFTFEAWGKAVRAGRTFTTTGPLIELTVEGQGLGNEIPLARSGATLTVKASAHSVNPFHVLEIVVNGNVVAQIRRDEGVFDLALQEQVRIEESSWIAARCLSKDKAWHVWPVHLAAHTSPVYISVAQTRLFQREHAEFMLTMLEGGLTWLDNLSIPPQADQQDRNRKIFIRAHDELHRLMKAHSHIG